MSPVSSASGMNSAGETRAALPMPPAQQRLGTDDAASAVDLRLVAEEELLLLQRLAQIPLERNPRGDHGLHLRIEETQGIATGRLGLVHGQIGPLHQFVDILLLATEQGDADTRRIVVLRPGQIVGAIENTENLLTDDPALLGGLLRLRAEILEHDHELVTAETGDGIAVPNAAGQALGDLLQQQITHGVTERVVERLEVVEVDEQQCTLPPRRALAAMATRRRSCSRRRFGRPVRGS
jgi:hypothetical protein